MFLRGYHLARYSSSSSTCCEPHRFGMYCAQQWSPKRYAFLLIPRVVLSTPSPLPPMSVWRNISWVRCTCAAVARGKVQNRFCEFVFFESQRPTTPTRRSALSTLFTDLQGGTDGPSILHSYYRTYTASTGTIGTTEAREQAIPEIQTSEILEYSRVSTVFDPKILRLLAVYTPEILPALKVLQLPSASRWGWNYRIGAQMVEVCFLLRVYILRI